MPSGTPVHAADGGRVILMGWVGGYGNYTCIQHTEQPVHLLRAPVELRDLERRVGEPGPGDRLLGLHGPLLRRHLHFETRVNGAPVDPMGYL